MVNDPSIIFIRTYTCKFSRVKKINKSKEIILKNKMFFIPKILVFKKFLKVLWKRIIKYCYTSNYNKIILHEYQYHVEKNFIYLNKSHQLSPPKITFSQLHKFHENTDT